MAIIVLSLCCLKMKKKKYFLYFKNSLAQSDYRHSWLRRMSLSNAIAPSVWLWLCLNVEGYRGKWLLRLHLSLITPSFFSRQPFTVRTFCQCIIPRPQSGSAISNGREPRSCLGRVFNIKLGSFVSKQLNCMSQTQPLLELKTRPRFCPASWSLSMPQFVLRLRHCTNIVIPTLPQPKPTTIHQPPVSLRKSFLSLEMMGAVSYGLEIGVAYPGSRWSKTGERQFFLPGKVTWVGAPLIL